MPETRENCVVCVVPTCRPESFECFIREWQPEPWDSLVVVADGSEELRQQIEWHVTAHATKPTLTVSTAGSPPLFARGTSGCRSYGFYTAAAQPLSRRPTHILTLDDDCYPAKQSPAAFVAQHLEALKRRPRIQSTLPDLRVRGLPYQEVGSYEVLVNVGLWHGVPDLDGPTQMALEAAGAPLPYLRTPPTVLATPHRVPMCGMNLMFDIRALPLMFFAPMGMNEHFDRFEDIWCGYVAQRVMADAGFYMSYGPPVVNHLRASNAIRNTVLEAPGIAFNERLVAFIDSIESASPPIGVALGVAGLLYRLRHLAGAATDALKPPVPWLDADERTYLLGYMNKLELWAEALERDVFC